MTSDVTLNYGSFNVWLTICSIYASILAFTAIIVAFILRKCRIYYYNGEKYSPRQPPRLSAHELLNLDSNRFKVTHEKRTALKRSSSKSRVKQLDEISFLEEQIQDVAVEKVCSDSNEVQGANIDKIQNIQVLNLDTCSKPNNIKCIVNSSNNFKSDYLDSKWADEIGLFNLKDDIKYKTSYDDCQAICKFGQIEKTFSFQNDLDTVEENLHPSYLHYGENTRQYTTNVNLSVTSLSIDNEISKILSYDTASCLKYCPYINDSVSSITRETESLHPNDDQMAFIMVNSLIAPVTFTYYGNVEQERLHDEEIKNESDLSCNAAFTIPEKNYKYQESDIVLNTNDEIIYPDLNVSEPLLSNNSDILCNKPTADVRNEIALNHIISDNTEVVKGVEDISEHYEMTIPTSEKDVGFTEAPVQRHDNNIVTKTNLSEKMPPEKRKTSVFVDKAGNISITLSPKELITDNIVDVSITEKTFVYKSDLGNISVTQVLPAINSEIEDSRESKFQLSDENSSTTEEILSCVIISDSEIQIKDTYKKEIENDILSIYTKLPRPKMSITYDLGISKEQDIPPNMISTKNIKTTIDQDKERKLDIKTLLNENTQYLKDESKKRSFSAMIPSSLLFHKSEIESKSTINNNIKTSTNQQLPTHVILSELKLKQQLYIESDAKDKFIIQLTEPTTLISSERSIHHFDKESNLSHTYKQLTGVTKSMLDSNTSFRKPNFQESIVTKIKSENAFHTDSSAIMRPEKTEQETTTSSISSILLDTETSKTGIENIIKSDFMAATQRTSSKWNSLNRESCSFIKFISNDVIMNCINKDSSFYSHNVTATPVQPTLVTQNICLKNSKTYYEDKLCTDSIEIQNLKCTVTSEIQEKVEKCILNDLLDMSNKNSEIVNKNMTTVISKHTDSNFQLKTTMHSKYNADHLFFSRQDDSYEKITVSCNESDNTDYSDLESISFEQQLYEQPNLHKTENIANDYIFIETNNQNDNIMLKHNIKKSFFDKVKITNTDDERYQIKPMLSVENEPEDSAPNKLITPQKNILGLGPEFVSPHPVELQNRVETETSTDLLRLNTCENILNDNKNTDSDKKYLKYTTDDILKDKTKIPLISPLRKTSPAETSYKTEDNKKNYVIPAYLKDVSDEIKILMNDLVKPTAEVLPFDTKEKKYLKQNSSTSSMEIQTNIFTSSQIDLQPTSSYIIIPNQKSKNIVTPKSKKKLNEKLDAASALRSSASSPPKLSKNKNIYTTLPIIQFDRQHPLNNVLIPPLKFVDQHRYKLNEYPEAVVIPMSKLNSSCTQTVAECPDSKSSKYTLYNNSRKKYPNSGHQPPPVITSK